MVDTIFHPNDVRGTMEVSDIPAWQQRMLAQKRDNGTMAVDRDFIRRHIVKIVKFFNDSIIELCPTNEEIIPCMLTDDDFVVRTGDVARLKKAIEDGDCLHPNQVKTMVKTLYEMRANPGKSGIIIGAMQSGKTMTGLSLLFVPPITYLLSKNLCLYPIFLTTNQNSHFSQTMSDYNLFMSLYGGLKVIVDDEAVLLHDYYGDDKTTKRQIDSSKDAKFREEPNVENYNESILRNRFNIITEDIDIFHKRVAGNTVKKLNTLNSKAMALGYTLFYIIDEPQFGASEKNGTCVMKEIFGEMMKSFADTDTHHIFIGLSATPFGFTQADNIFKVRQFIGDNYTGLNMFEGQPIDPTIKVKIPSVFSFKEVSDLIEDDFDDIRHYMGLSSEKQFETWVTKNDYDGSNIDTMAIAKEMFYNMLDKILFNNIDPSDLTSVGMCVRFCSKRAKTEEIIESLELTKMFDVIRFYDDNHCGMRIKDIIANRPNKNKPFMIVVVAKARMGDSFPNSVELFVDFTNEASDINALLQGLFGRSCGYGKERSKVVMSDKSAAMLRMYVETKGFTTKPASRHTERLEGKYGRGKPITMLKLDRQLSPKIAAFVDDVQATLVQLYPKMSEKRASLQNIRRNTDTYVNIFDLMDRHDMWSYVVENHQSLFPKYSHVFMARPGVKVDHTTADGENIKLSYEMKGRGSCTVTLRSSDALHLRPRGTTRNVKLNVMEPQINLIKLDDNGNVITDKRPGLWTVHMVSIPLVRPSKIVVPKVAHVPTEESIVRYFCTDAQKAKFDKLRKAKRAA
ncbi:MAG: hypothetical protein WC284_15275 [Candidimonas sp.]